MGGTGPGAESKQAGDWNNFLHRVLAAVGVTAAVTVLLLFLWRAFQVLLLVFAGIVLGVFLRWLKEHVSRLLRLPSGLALAVVVLLGVALLGGGIALSAPMLKEQISGIIERIPEQISNIQERLQRSAVGEELVSQAEQAMEDSVGTPPEGESGGEILGRVAGLFSTTLGAIAGILIVAVISIYVAAEPELYTNGILRLVPLNQRKRAREIMARLDCILRWWFAGQCLSMLVLGTLTTLGLLALGIPLALVLGLIAAVMTFIPNLGPFIAAIPALLLAMGEEPMKVIYVAILYLIIQNIEGYFITPMVHRRIISMPPALIISVQITLAMLVGFMGVLMAMPLVACGMVLVQMLYVEDVLGDSMDRPPVEPDRE